VPVWLSVSEDTEHVLLHRPLTHDTPPFHGRAGLDKEAVQQPEVLPGQLGFFLEEMHVCVKPGMRRRQHM
jgi:hypothetical protein